MATRNSANWLLCSFSSFLFSLLAEICLDSWQQGRGIKASERDNAMEELPRILGGAGHADCSDFLFVYLLSINKKIEQMRWQLMTIENRLGDTK
ncbi:MAG: hypothetical protein OXI86_00970 [Candidatus Poribacteria bacterium]|nr:hypothetical protein [Candidatus Poribacteria bacterium]